VQTTNVQLSPGVNRLPQLYNASVSVRSTEPQVHVRATTTPLVGTSPGEGRSPQATMAAFDMSWPDGIGLAVELLRYAKVCRVDLPPGLEVPIERLTLISSERGSVNEPSTTADEIGPLRLIYGIDPAISESGNIVSLRFLRGDGQQIETYFQTDTLPEIIDGLRAVYDEAIVNRK